MKVIHEVAAYSGCVLVGLNWHIVCFVLCKTLLPVNSLKSDLSHVSLQPFSVDVGYERFLGPEIFFHPEVRKLT